MKETINFNISKFDETLDLDYIKYHGRVERISDGIVFCSGLESAKLHELILIDNKYTGIVLDLSESYLGIGLFEDSPEIKEGMEAVATKQLFKLNASHEQLGTIIDTLGNRIDGGAPISKAVGVPAFNLAQPIMSIEDVSKPLMTGQLIIDALTPIGHGQRQLVLGNRQTGKTQIALETILNQKGKNVRCIYVAIGQKMAYIADIAETLEKSGAMQYTTILSASASTSITMQYLAPYAGMAIAEYWASEGERVVIVFDDLSKHADTYRTISLLFKRPPGREAYPGDIFYIHSSLLERASQLNAANGSGSISALPIIELLSDDLTAYIPTNIISITDGQLYLKSELFNGGQKPAIATGESVSRVGANAQYPLMQEYSSRLMLIISQYSELKEFLTFDNNISKENLIIIKKGQILLELFKQGVQRGYSEAQELILLYAFKHDHMLDMSIPEIAKFKVILIEKLAAELEFSEYNRVVVEETVLPEPMVAVFDTLIASSREALTCPQQ